MPDVQIIPVPLHDRALVERFIRMPWSVYREQHPSEHWVPPLLMDRRDYLDEKKNPLFEHVRAAFFLAIRGGRDVGRIAAVHDFDWERFHGEKVGYFGMFECWNDPEVAGALIEAARAFHEREGRVEMIGPLELTTNYVSGLLVKGFDSDPGIQMPYHPPYYEALLLGAGCEKRKDLFQWWLATSTPIPEKVLRIADKVKERNRIVVRTMDLGRWDEEVTRVLSIYNDAWEKNWGFVPMGDKEFRHLATDLKMVLLPDLALMAEVDGEPVAFSITIQDIHPIQKKLDGRLFPFGIFRLLWDLKVRKAVTRGRLLALGIKGGYRRRGIDSVLFAETHKAATRVGWEGGEIGWTLEDNDMVNRSIEAMAGTHIKTYRVYSRSTAPRP